MPDPQTGSAADDELLARAREIVAATERGGAPVRVVGGLAIRALCPGLPVRARDGQDLDVAARSKHTKKLRLVLEAEGFEPDAEFNAVHGARQLRFAAADGSLTIDVLLDKVAMSHELDLRDRLEFHELTLGPCDLLLSKLQIHELNQKDLHDIVLLLAAVPVREGDEPNAIGLDRFGDIVRADWGWWRTSTENLERARDTGRDAAGLGPDTPHDPSEQAQLLLDHAESVPKTVGWRMRAKVGERKRWYEVPEEVEEA